MTEALPIDPEVAKRLNEKLSRWLKETNAPMPAHVTNP